MEERESRRLTVELLDRCLEDAMEEPRERAVDALKEQVVRALAAADLRGGVEQIEIRAPVETWRAVAREFGWGEEPWREKQDD